MTNLDIKIFCIGFNKTGTTSLHSFFSARGLICVHNTEWCNNSHLKNGKSYYRGQCYSDGEQCNYIKLQKWFPNSLYILNTRDLRDWLHSRIKHVMRYNEKVKIKNILTNNKYGKMAKDFYCDEVSTIKKWILERKIYHNQVRLYFNNQINFKEIDITKSTIWTEELFTFCAVNNYKISNEATIKTIHINKRNKDNIDNQYLLQKYFKLVDDILTN